jgi:hypothetical protein
MKEQSRPVHAQAARARRRRSSTNEPMASPPSTMTGIAKRALRIVPPQCRSRWIVLTASDEPNHLLIPDVSYLDRCIGRASDRKRLRSRRTGQAVKQGSEPILIAWLLSPQAFAGRCTAIYSEAPCRLTTDSLRTADRASEPGVLWGAIACRNHPPDSGGLCLCGSALP